MKFVLFFLTLFWPLFQAYADEKSLMVDAYDGEGILFSEYSKQKGLGKIDLVNAGMAVELAEIYVMHVYGKECVEKERPFYVTDKGRYWRIEGYLPPDMTGGVFLIEIDKENGRVMTLSHGK
ncbi:YbbC/YhhH family protein [Leminorella grimontii]|uniref:YbbC/YhhH family protein n=1 Tax=Leminorella grimontii TaxID=82981 RepID=UPI00321FEBB7